MTERPDAGVGYVAVATSVLLAGGAQILMKISMLELAAEWTTGSGTLDGWLAPPVVMWLSAGLACYAISMLAWLIALARFDLSYAYPFLGLSYGFVYVVAVLCPRLDESFSSARTAGIALIALGAMLVWRTGTPEPPVQTPRPDYS